MRTAVAFAVVAVVLFATGALGAFVALDRPPKDSALSGRGSENCDKYALRATGGLAWLRLEGGMWEFNSDDTVYDLYGVETYLPADGIAWLQDHEGSQVPATLEGVVNPCAATYHMRGFPVQVTAVDVNPDATMVR